MRYSAAAAVVALAAGASAADYGYNQYPAPVNSTSSYEAPPTYETPSHEESTYGAETPAYEPEYPEYTTEVVTAYETYCPSATEIVHGSKTYTVTEATTLTITDCPCTISKPVTYSTVTKCNTCEAHTPVAPYPTPSAPAPTYGTGAPPTYGTAAPTKSQPPVSAYTGAANKAVAASGAGFAAVFGFIAYFL